jgi:hypothetical protein
MAGDNHSAASGRSKFVVRINDISGRPLRRWSPSGTDMMSAISRAAATSFSRGQGEASLTSFAAAPGSNANSNFGRAERFPRAKNIAEADTNDGDVH